MTNEQKTDSLGDGIETVVKPDWMPPRIEYRIDGLLAVTVRVTEPPTALIGNSWSRCSRSDLLRHAVALIFAADRMNQIEFEQNQAAKLALEST